MSFPGECATNAFVLDGFAQIVYMVSTVAGQAGKSEGATLSILQNAERELRTQASILVSLDHDTNELFTFYRSGDLQRDAKQIFGKLRTVLMHNSCIMSFKSGVKAGDLATKDEHSRLYRFFITAVFLALKPNFLSSSDTIPLGFRSFLRGALPPISTTFDVSGDSQTKQWQINVVDLQLMSNGQLLVLNKSISPEYLSPVCDILETKSFNGDDDFTSRPCSITLAPTGQMGRYTNGRIISLPISRTARSRPDTGNSQDRYVRFEDARTMEWARQVDVWLIEQGCQRIDFGGTWIEIEVPFLHKNETLLSENNSDELDWKRLFWPLKLCFCMSPPASKEFTTDYEDSKSPVDFLQNWMMKAEDRARAIAGKASTDSPQNKRSSGLHEVGDFDDVFGLDDRRHSHTMIPMNIPPGQLIYPTPPDASLTQPTPGISSVDGVGMTPVDTTRLPPDQTVESFDSEFSHNAEATGVGTGMYDEDLFEDMPDNQFGATTGADEPNWDFFDHQPDLEMPDIGAPSETSRVEEAQDAGITQTRTEMESERLEEKASDLMPPPSKIGPITAISTRSTPEKVLDQSGTSEQETTRVTKISADADAVMDIDMQSHRIVGPDQALQSPVEVSPLSQDAALHNVRVSGRRSSLYDSIGPTASSEDYNKRYSTNGQFWFDIGSAKMGQKEPGGDTKKIDPPYHDPRSGISSPRSSSNSFDDSDDSSDYVMNAKDSPSSVKRKWTEYMQNSPLADPNPTLNELRTLEAESRRLLSLLRPDNLDQTWIFTNIDYAKVTMSADSGRNELTMTAQILVDQLSQSCLDHKLGGQPLQKSKAGANCQSIAQLDSMFGKCEGSKLHGLTVAKDTAGNVIEDASRLLPLEVNQISLFKGEKALALSPTVLPLWETLSLHPKGGEKNILAFCVHPASSSYEAGCEFFLDRLGETYVNCNLGRHRNGKIAGMSNSGLFQWSDGPEASPNLQQCCERLGVALARLVPSEDNIVIYMVTGAQKPSSYVALVEAFCVLFDAYLKTSDKKCPNEIALQLVPHSFVASVDFVVVPPPREYISLAIEVYNRCPPSTPGDELGLCGSAVVLAESPRRRIRFDMPLGTGAATDFAGRSLHLAYSRSANRQWLTAAWTDERGFIALTTSYCFGLATRQPRPRIDIIRDMWEISQELMAKEREGWRLVVAREGFFEPEEINEWAVQMNDTVAAGSSRPPAKCFLALMTVDLNPSLTVQSQPSHQKIAAGATPQQAPNNYGTPVSTPQAASTTSPEQLLAATPTPGGTAPPLNAPTPPEHTSFDPNNEADVVVVDPLEESWTVVLPFGLNQSTAVLERRPALLSGYLLKRKGRRDEEGLVMLGVNLVFASAVQTQGGREDLLKDTLGQYRGLVTLARTRGWIEPVGEVVPWHVATAVKGVKILETLL